MIVVSDTTPLISLMKIGQLDLIEQLFGEIQIPNAVYNELVSNARFPEESSEIRGRCQIVVWTHHSGKSKPYRRP